MATNTVRLHRVLRATPERVYRAFLDADAMAKLLPPNGFTGYVKYVDTRVGGTYKMSFTNFSRAAYPPGYSDFLPGHGSNPEKNIYRRFMIMKKILTTFILAALPLYLCNGFFSCAYGHSLVFGPEICSGESGKSRHVVKRFSVHDTNQKFFVSVQSGGGSEKGVARGTIKINGKLIFSADEIGKPFKMLTKPVTLQKQNNISVDMTGESDSPVIVTIMSLKAQKVTAKISPLGGRVNLEEYALITFPAKAFDDTQEVTMSVNASPSTQDIFEANAPGPRLPYEIRINTGDKAPATTVSVGIKYPDSFFSSDYQMHICARMYDNPETPDVHDRFCVIDSGVGHTGAIITSLPKEVFSNHYGKNGTYEAIITVVLVQ